MHPGRISATNDHLAPTGRPGDGMVKGLARPWDCPRHDQKVEYVDAGLFLKKSGYSPMTIEL